jgi:EAL domain-containing protein (putative c-di-GMP-specific phosphodiesterase class I)
VQLASPGWRETFVETLARYELDPSRLVIEITETAAMALSARTIEDLTALRDLGVGIHVDDFGTGFSSISLLRDLPVTGLKFDASFVADLSDGGESAHALSDGLAGLVNRLHLMGIAEGVESQDQHEALARHGWSHSQGYLYAHPQPQPVLGVETPDP